MEIRDNPFARVLMMFWGSLLFVGGCTEEEAAPQITHDYSLRRPIPSAPRRTRPKPVERSYSSVPGDWFPPSWLERRWMAIVIHHSATAKGNAAIFDRSHKEYNDWDGVGYDFVIGNGTNSGDGEVEVTFRWRQQRTGAHCKTPNNWANEKAVGICLVGNFNQSVPTGRQMWSLAKLVRFLQGRYRIPASRIYGHRDTPGARVTECPGRKFGMGRLKSMLD